jgi:threonine dehydrogenase-like Zn-dependent dehydrogenase
MRAVTIVPGKDTSLCLDDVDEPPPEQGAILVGTLAVGICGTDLELIEGAYGEACPGHERLIIGHESLGRVLQAPAGSGFDAGDTVVGMVRRPDPLPCESCAQGEPDMCRNGLFTERGIKQADGFAAERWRSAPEFLTKVSAALGLAAVLLEPASVLAKAWEHIERISARSRAAPRRVLVTGAGPVGLMAALLGVQRGLEVHVLDRNRSGPKPSLVSDLGAEYHLEFPRLEADIVVEATGAAAVIVAAVTGSAPGSIVCLTGLGGREHAASFDAARLNQSLVLENRVVFGSVNANRRHYEAAAQALARAPRAWLDRVITRQVPLANWRNAYAKARGQVKTVLTF